MKRMYASAIDKFSTSNFSRWLLPDGQFLGVPDYEDHRIVGQFCNDSWLEFIEGGAASLHYDSNCGYMWIRTIGLNPYQREALREALEILEYKIRDAKIDIYEGTRFVEDICIEDSSMAELYILDPIAYQIELSYQKDLEEDYE